MSVAPAMSSAALPGVSTTGRASVSGRLPTGGAMSPASGLPLQREAGGAAAAMAPTPLDEGAVADALRYYRRQRWKYGAGVIREIRVQLGLAPGGIDEDLVHAVARFQQSQRGGRPLVVDGKAGPNTLPRLFPTGLSRPDEAKAFGQALQAGVLADWKKLGTAAGRLAAVKNAVNARLVAAGVPEVEAGLGGGAAVGVFMRSEWKLYINERNLKEKGLDVAAAKELAEFAYHEARHGEQVFRIARYLAGHGWSVGGVARKTGIPRRVAQAAKATPLQPGTAEALVAQGWFDSLYGRGLARTREVVRAAIQAKWEVLTHECRCSLTTCAQHDPQLAAAKRAYAARLDAYKTLAHENDSYATGSLAADAVRVGTKKPAPLPQDACERLKAAGRSLPSVP